MINEENGFKIQSINGGFQALKFFPNGYGVSIVRHQFSYGGNRGLFELAVLAGDSPDNFELTYDTPITCDVIGNLSADEALEIAEQVSQLS